MTQQLFLKTTLAALDTFKKAMRASETFTDAAVDYPLGIMHRTLSNVIPSITTNDYGATSYYSDESSGYTTPRTFDELANAMRDNAASIKGLMQNRDYAKLHLKDPNAINIEIANKTIDKATEDALKAAAQVQGVTYKPPARQRG